MVIRRGALSICVLLEVRSANCVKYMAAWAREVNEGSTTLWCNDSA
jgi:hypothetical protein